MVPAIKQVDKKSSIKIIDSAVSRGMKIITVITPSYNQGEFIEETIQTVLFQKGNFYIDYIIMDGGSTDNSVKIIRKYENLLVQHCGTLIKDNLKYYIKRDEGFRWNRCRGISYRWQSEKDNGQVHALKKGFKLAKGDIYGWLNSDDIYVNPGVLQQVCAYFNEEPDLELLCGDGPFISKTGEEMTLHHVDQVNLKKLIYLDYHILQPATFFHKNIYDETLLNERFTCAFDANFFIGMLYNGVNYKKVNDRFAAFRLYDEIKTLKLLKRRYKEQIQITRKYSHNRYLMNISTIYRKIQGLYEARFKKKKPFVWLWVIIRGICYKLVTGRWKR
jgi:glycosyltransferase involved in cell wall biosynthesis